MSRAYITKSKRGHYTVTIRNSNKQLVCIHNKISSLGLARELAAELLKGQP
jgi:hypothetical protein